MGVLPLIRGDRAVQVFTFKTANGAPYPLDGCTVWFTVKTMIGQSDDNAPIKHYWRQAAEFGLSRTDPDTGSTSPLSAGVLYNEITSDESGALRPLYTTHVYDVQISDINGDVRTVDLGSVRVTADVTRRTTTP